jgi:capsid protein
VESLADLNRGTQLSTASNDFIRFTKTMLASRFNRAEAISIANDVSPRVKEILKGAVETGSLGGVGWGAPLAPAYRQISDGFVASMPPFSAYDKIYADGAFARVPLRTVLSIASSAATGSTVSELAAKPLSQISFTGATLEPIKTSSFIVISDELARSALPAAVSQIGNELRRACALATDSAFLAALAASTGVATNASTGLTAAAFISDLDTALAAVSIGANSKLYLVLPPNICKSVALLRDTSGPLFPQMTVTGGTIQGIRVVISDAATDTGTLVDAAQVASENDIVTLMSAEHAAIQTDDNPTSGATTLVSLWQNNLTGLRAERWFGVEVLRANALALITNMQTTA